MCPAGEPRSAEAENCARIVPNRERHDSAGPMAGLCGHIVCASSSKALVIQQIHMVAADIICGLGEARICREPEPAQAGVQVLAASRTLRT